MAKGPRQAKAKTKVGTRNQNFSPILKAIFKDIRTELQHHTDDRLNAINLRMIATHEDLTSQKDWRWKAILESRLELCQTEKSLLKMQKELYEFVMDLSMLHVEMIADTDKGVLATKAGQLIRGLPSKKRTQVIVHKEIVRILRQRLAKMRKQTREVKAQPVPVPDLRLW